MDPHFQDDSGVGLQWEPSALPPWAIPHDAAELSHTADEFCAPAPQQERLPLRCAPETLPRPESPPASVTAGDELTLPSGCPTEADTAPGEGAPAAEAEGTAEGSAEAAGDGTASSGSSERARLLGATAPLPDSTHGGSDVRCSDAEGSGTETPPAMEPPQPPARLTPVRVAPGDDDGPCGLAVVISDGDDDLGRVQVALVGPGGELGAESWVDPERCRPLSPLECAALRSRIRPAAAAAAAARGCSEGAEQRTGEASAVEQRPSEEPAAAPPRPASPPCSAARSARPDKLDRGAPPWIPAWSSPSCSPRSAARPRRGSAGRSCSADAPPWLRAPSTAPYAPRVPHYSQRRAAAASAGWRSKPSRDPAQLAAARREAAAADRRLAWCTNWLVSWQASLRLGSSPRAAGAPRSVHSRSEPGPAAGPQRAPLASPPRVSPRRPPTLPSASPPRSAAAGWWRCAFCGLANAGDTAECGVCSAPPPASRPRQRPAAGCTPLSPLSDSTLGTAGRLPRALSAGSPCSRPWSPSSGSAASQRAATGSGGQACGAARGAGGGGRDRPPWVPWRGARRP
eukprot:TRINITY_DN5410_c0_g2_i1.p1 TRINITY_DN5410_c0_g2~~TRINITY_DN5410_c0_g2_i1.p1  ORF type:complete len:571 (+),score=89.93 TRINITY_DN5410_c0_g2_i1:69-1781(+)